MLVNMKKAFAFCLLFILFSCSPESANDGRRPLMEMELNDVGLYSATLTFRALYADHMQIIIDSSEDLPTEDKLLAEGRSYPIGRIVLDNLDPGVEYFVYAMPVGGNDRCGEIATLSFQTIAQGDPIYDWEKDRRVLPDITDMILCYGGSEHRAANTEPWEGMWPKERFAPMVSCIDRDGKEQWLFESFLCLEFVDTKYNRAYWCGQPYTLSADKSSWIRLMDYWFAKDNGFDALDQAVDDAAKRIGAPKSKRFVIMAMPDAVLYSKYDDVTSTSVYWGWLDGINLDFQQPSHRLAAEKWFCDEVRRRFDEAGYRNIELVGFYVISEDITFNGDGWCPELKRNEDIFPQICDYLHTVNEGMYWIPYYNAAPYRTWHDLHLDWVVMQPNHFWDDTNKNPMSMFYPMIMNYDMGMEIEFDDLVLSSSANPVLYRKRLRDYLDGAKENGVWGQRPFGVYQGDDTFYRLSISKDPEDRAIYEELRDFFLDNPQKKY